MNLPLKRLTAAVLFGRASTLVGVASAQQVSAPAKFADVTQPAKDVVMQASHARAVARMAYIRGGPMVNMINRHDALSKAPMPGKLNGVLPVAPQGKIGMLNNYIDPSQTFVNCPNQDVVCSIVDGTHKRPDFVATPLN